MFISGPVENQIGRSDNNASIFSRLEANQVGHLLIRLVFVLMGAFPARRIPNLETSRTADECDFVFEIELLTEVIGQNQTALPVGRTMLRPRMELALEFANVASGNSRRLRGGRANPLEFVRRHHEQTAQVLLGEENELFSLAVAPPP